MKPLALPVSFAVLLGTAIAFGPRDDYPSVASRVVATHAPTRAGTDAAARVKAATALLDALDEPQRERCVLAVDDAERRHWTNLPSRADERGVRFGDLSKAQLEKACDFLATVLSDAGYVKVRDVMLGDDRLLRDGMPRVGFGVESFWLVLFGTPSVEEKWALQLDGHHLALNLTFEGDAVGLSPSFLGAQPATYERDGNEVEPLRGQTQRAFALVESLSEEQRDAAVVSPKRGDLQAGAGRDGFVPEPTGLSCKSLDESQRALLAELLREYVDVLPEVHADASMRALGGEIDEMVFAWSGPTHAPGDVSYRVQGPSILVEYACQDLGGNPLQHLHSIYRDPEREYEAR